MKSVKMHPPAGTALYPIKKDAGLRLVFQPQAVKTYRAAQEEESQPCSEAYAFCG
jgi:hypothetical protein